MRSAIKSMNNCVKGFLHLTDIGNGFQFAGEDEIGFEGNAEGYIKKLEFKEGAELDIDEEWDGFCDELFNNWNNTNYNFYKDVDGWADLAQEFNSKELIWLLSETNKYWLDTVGDPLDTEMFDDEELLWNNISYYWIRMRSDEIKAFILKKIQEKFDEWKEEQKEDGNYRLTCDICYRNKQIKTYSACCNDKKFCGGCYKKLKGNPCPYCRGEIDHKVGDDDIRGQPDFQDWMKEMTGIEYELKTSRFVVKKKIIKRKRELMAVIETPLETWKNKIERVCCELLYNAGKCYNHYNGCYCHYEKFICGREDTDGIVCENDCSIYEEFCKDCLEQELGMN